MRVKVVEGRPDPFLYRGFLRCAECHRRLITVAYTNKGQNNFHAEYYVCQGAHGARSKVGTWIIKNGTCPTRRIRREALEPLLDSVIADRLADPKFLSKIIEAQQEADETLDQKVEGLTHEIEEALRSIDRNQELFARGKVTQAAFDRLDSKLQLELGASRAALAKARPNYSKLTPETWRPIALKFKRWHKLERAQKRILLAAIAPTFEAAGYAGKGYHDTTIKVKGFRLNLAGDSGSQEEGDSPSGSGLVPNRNLSCLGLNINQSEIYLIL
jgi:hypothetical protein